MSAPFRRSVSEWFGHACLPLRVGVSLGCLIGMLNADFLDFAPESAQSWMNGVAPA
jgi:hypothetical protein